MQEFGSRLDPSGAKQFAKTLVATLRANFDYGIVSRTMVNFHYFKKPSSDLAQTENSLPPENFFPLFFHLLIFFQVNFLKKFFQEYDQSVKQIGSTSGQAFCRA